MEKFKYSTACKVGNAIENSVEQVYLENPQQPSWSQKTCVLGFQNNW